MNSESFNPITPESAAVAGAIHSETASDGNAPLPSGLRAADSHPENEARFRAVFEHAGLGIVLIETEQWRIVDSNPAFSRLSGYSAPELRGRPLAELLPEPDWIIHEHRYRELVAADGKDSRDCEPGRGYGQLEQKFRHRDGSLFWTNVTYSLVPGADGRPRFLMIIVKDISDRKATEMAIARALALADASRARAERLASTDCLTGLLNQRALLNRLDSEIDRARREHRALSIILLDLDYFKQINDNHGHQAGDLALKTFAACLCAHCRPGDFAGRYGGEEFIVGLPETDGAAALRSAERLRAAVASLSITITPPGEPQTIRLEITASFGVASLPPESAVDLKRLFRRADQAMYQAKRAGRNCVRVYADESDL